MIKRTELRLVAIDGVDVPDIAALEAGFRRVIGKRIDPATGATSMGDASVVVIDGHEGPNHAHFYGAAIKHGELLAGDAATAAFLGVPYSSAPRMPASAPSKAGDS